MQNFRLLIDKIMAKIKSKKGTKSTKKRKVQKCLINQPAWLTNNKVHNWVLFLMGVLLYANTFTHDFAQDDAIVITDNMFTQQGISGIPGILTKDTFFGFFKDENKANLVAGGRYRPLTLVLFALEYELFGENPTVNHIVNALLYGLTGVFLYLLLLQFFPKKKDETKSFWIALAGSLLFIAHPIHTEAVANIKGRDEIMTLLLSLMALFYAFRAYRTKRLGLSVLAGVLFFLALLAKENAITFLAVVPLAFTFSRLPMLAE